MKLIKSSSAAFLITLAPLATINAAVVLVVDVSDPSAVTFTAQDAASDVSSSLNRSFEGLTIENFFTASITVSANPPRPIAGDLTPSLGIQTNPYVGTGTFDYGNSTNFGPGNDLSVFADNTVENSQQFTAGQRAFNGQAIIDFSTEAAVLPSVGSTGDVITGFDPSNTGEGLVIGQWTVVPEPSSTLMLFAALIGFGSVRRRK